MKLITILPVCILLIGIFCNKTVADFQSAGPIQIVLPVNQSFQLELNELNHILNADEIKDQNVVVVSIAGAFRSGKSFLLNFFLKYLYAKVRFRKLNGLGIDILSNKN